jgi:hypothetical protein
MILAIVEENSGQVVCFFFGWLEIAYYVCQSSLGYVFFSISMVHISFRRSYWIRPLSKLIYLYQPCSPTLGTGSLNMYFSIHVACSPHMGRLDLERHALGLGSWVSSILKKKKLGEFDGRTP